MLLFRKLLLNKYLYYIIFFIVILTTIIRLNIKITSNYTANCKKAVGIVDKIKINDDVLVITIKDLNNELLLIKYYLKNNKYVDINLGYKIEVYGEFINIKKSTTINTFDYKKYSYNKRMFYIVNASYLKIVNKNIGIIYKLKNNINNYFSTYKNGKYLKLILLGDKSEMDSEIIESFRNNGYSHLFAISGMHVSFITSFILLLLKKIKVKEEKRYLIAIIFLFIYLMVIGNSPSIVRAFLFFLLLSINKIYYFYIDVINIFILTLSITLLINPFYIYDLGFLYSFIISLSLILSSHILNKYKNYFVKLAITSVISFLASIPITLYNFYELNILGIIYNLFYVPFVTFILFPLSIIILILKPLSFIYDFFILILENTSILLNNITFGKLIFGKLNIIIYVLYLILFLIALYKNKIIIIYFVLLVSHYFYFDIFNYSYLTMLDIGQGDSFLLHSRGETVLIDTGGIMNYYKKSNNTLVKNITLPYMKSMGIRKIQKLILTHGDYDHLGEALYLIEKFRVDKVLINEGHINYLENKIIEKFNNVEISFEGKTFNVGDFYFQELNTDLKDENDSSSIYYVTNGKIKILFTGDASKKSESYVINNYNIENIDILKVGHHGSNTSSGKSFINKINPKIALISVGENNKFNHPNKETLEVLKNSKIYRTDLDGSITIKFKNNKLKIETCSP